MKHHATIDEETLAVLRLSTITATTVALPATLARPLYEKVNKVLSLAGGKWNRGAKAHVFPRDPREVLGLALDAGTIKDVKKATQAFYTPPEIARRVILHASVAGRVVLEPSAGMGALADAAFNAGAAQVVCIELDPQSAEALRGKGHHAIEGDFLLEKHGNGFDRIVMNPPFTAGQDVSHVTHAFRSHLRPGGRLVAIMSTSWRTNQTGRARAFRDLLDQYGRVEEELPAGTFSESGTQVATVIVILNAPQS